ncbi:ABC transporter substrate-binding protein [Pararobbsia silviterrae]|uniref:ABC transporter substrate-binding protein n=1 Tax=Pararobbsia silviterrae TaxID=1792498 RepID=A0A494Y4W9_9BURK|nr:ABC transporter substrate-binding protein [Pararobbsia silviterrae]RKP57756.1 ABC transporter substrate-binding protein [Pararobbsia silviterrae]
MTSRRDVLKQSLLLGLGMTGLGNVLGSSAFAATRSSIVISEAIRLGMYASLYVAQDQKLFDQRGLDAEIVSAGSVSLPVPVLLSGRAQIAVTSPGMSVNAVQAGGKLKNIAKIVGGVSMWLIAKPGSPIKSIDDLKGKTIATLMYPSSTIQVPEFAMKQFGKFDPKEAGVKFLELPPGAQAAAVKDGRADVAAVFEWDASIGATQFGLVPVLSFADMFGPLAFTTAFTTEAFIQDHPDEVQAFCDAIADAQSMMHADPGVFTRVAQVYFPKVPPAVVAAATPHFVGANLAIPANPVISRDDWDHAMQLELAGGSVKQTLPYEQMVDPRFAAKSLTRAQGAKA